jgi:pimeloyl-ACP methyl ester carboxylesterase/dienelactone hydrolase
MSPSPRWISAEVELASLWFEPTAGSSQDRGGPSIVVVPGYGYTEMVTRYGWTQFAERCASHGLRTVLFDHPCTNDSADSQDGLNVVSWTTALRDVVRRVPAPVVLVGVRLGATLAAAAASCTKIDTDAYVASLVLWAPVVSGRKFRRELTLLASTSPHTVDETGLTFGGFEYPNAFLDQIAELELASICPGNERPVLVVDDARRPIRDETAAALVEAGWVVTRISCSETAAWVDESSEHSAVPTAAITLVVDWIVKQHLPSASIGVASPCGDSSSRISATGVESFCRRGTPQLSVVQHTPLERRSDIAVIMLNSGVERAVGPGRAWVDAARRWAQQGLVVLRAEHSSTGDSGVWPDQLRNDVYGEHGSDDITLMIQHAVELGCSQVLLIGMCSSAYAVLEFGPHPLVCQTISIHPQLYRIGTPAGPVEEVTNHAKHRLAQIDSKLGLRRKANSVKSLTGRHHEAFSWLDAYAETTTAAVLLFGESDRGLRFLEREDPREFLRLQVQRAIEVQRFAAVDHALHSWAGRQTMMSAVHSIVLRTATVSS